MSGLRKIQIDLGVNNETGLIEKIDVLEISIFLGFSDENGNKVVDNQYIKVSYQKLVFDKLNKVIVPRQTVLDYTLVERPPANTSLTDWNSSLIADAIEAAIVQKIKAKHNIS